MISKIQSECPLCILMSDTGSRGNALYHRRHRCIQDEPRHSYIHEFLPSWCSLRLTFILPRTVVFVRRSASQV